MANLRRGVTVAQPRSEAEILRDEERAEWESWRVFLRAHPGGVRYRYLADGTVERSVTA
jgi:hypothetical protein